MSLFSNRRRVKQKIHSTFYGICIPINHISCSEYRRWHGKRTFHTILSTEWFRSQAEMMWYAFFQVFLQSVARTHTLNMIYHTFLFTIDTQILHLIIAHSARKKLRQKKTHTHSHTTATAIQRVHYSFVIFGLCNCFLSANPQPNDRKLFLDGKWSYTVNSFKTRSQHCANNKLMIKNQFINTLTMIFAIQLFETARTK